MEVWHEHQRVYGDLAGAGIAGIRVSRGESLLWKKDLKAACRFSKIRY